MNFQDLMQKMKDIDEAVMAPPSGPEIGECGDEMPVASPELPSGDQLLVGEKSMEECGDAMPGGMMGMRSGQPDNVTMNISMNGSGAGGIRDLMSILRDIEHASGDSGHADVDAVLVGTEEGYANEPNPQTSGIDAVTPVGADLGSKGGEAHKVNGGGNPMHEALATKLAQMYEDIKSK